jgi:hypothetical protein
MNEQITSIDIINTVLSSAAILVSGYSLYRQYRVKGALVELLNVHDIQRSMIRVYAGLPKIIQDSFPAYAEDKPGYALVKGVYGNSGDRTGIVNVHNTKVKAKNLPPDIKASHYSYTLIPAYEIVEQAILLRNIPLGSNAIELEIELTIESGGYQPRSGKYLRKGTIRGNLKVTLIPSNDVPFSAVTIY